jgi:hypothetical protein
MNSGWWVEYTIKRAFQEGFAILVAGPCGAHKNTCEVKVQRTTNDWVEIEPWYKEGIRHKSINLTVKEGEDLYQLFSNARLLAFPPVVAGIDGETHTLVLGASSNIAHYQWFVDLPDEWKELGLGVKRLAELAEQCFAAST